MFTFLPRTYRIEVEREYRKRLLTVVWTLVFILVLAGTVLSLPSYFMISAKKAAADISFASSVTPAPETIDLEAQVKNIETKTNLLSPSFNQKLLASVLEQVAIKVAQPGISITGLSLKRGGQGSTGSISLSGVARTRDNLVSFSKVLSADPTLQNVSLPVSALAKSKDIPFTLSVNSQF
jgi:hypothetical protein